MTLTVHELSARSFDAMLESLGEWLEKAAAHAERHELDLIHARLAPDMYTLAQQVQLACQHARDGVGRLLGKPGAEAPQLEGSWAGLQAQLAGARAQLAQVSAAALEDAAERDCSIATGDGSTLTMNGAAFLRAWALPHFYFHVVTAYGILRHHGVPLGKRDYLSQVAAFIAAKRP